MKALKKLLFYSLLFILINTLNLISQNPVWEINHEIKNLSWIRFFDDGERFIHNAGGKLHVRSIHNGRLIDSLIDPDGNTYLLNFGRDKSTFVTITDNVGFNIYDSKSLRLLKKLPYPKSIFKYSKNNLGGHPIDYHYDQESELFYVLQGFNASYKNPITENQFFYGARFYVIDLRADSMIFEKLFYTELNHVTYARYFTFYVNRMLVSNSGDVIINEEAPRMGIHFFKNNLKDYMFISDPFIKNGTGNTIFFELFDNQTKFIRGISQNIWHPVFGHINYFVHDIETGKLIDYFNGPVIYNKSNIYQSYNLINDSLIFVNNKYFSVYNIIKREYEFSRQEPFEPVFNTIAYSNNKYLISNDYNSKYIAMLDFDLENLSNIPVAEYNNDIKINLINNVYNEHYSLTISNIKPGNMNISLYNSLGSRVSTIYNNETLSLELSFLIDISSYSSGIYYLIIKNGTSTHTRILSKVN